jgi:alpha-galactosidase
LPGALLLNYTNPMAMLTWLHAAGSRVRTVGLCHSVQGTAGELARYLNVPLDEVNYLCAGINHQAWYLRLRRGDEDLYPRLRALLDDPEAVAKDRVRFEMFKHFGCFVTSPRSTARNTTRIFGAPKNRANTSACRTGRGGRAPRAP